MNAAVLNKQLKPITRHENVKEERPALQQKIQNESDALNKKMQRASRASKIIHTRVKNFQGNTLGYIKDIVIEPESGVVVYAVISFGGEFGNQSIKLFAVPWLALNWDGEKKHYAIEVDRATLEESSGFDDGHWPDSSIRWD